MSPTPDLASTFATQLKAWDGRARCAITGTVKVGDLTLAVTGEYSSAGGNSLTNLTMTTADGQVVVHSGSASFDGVSYQLSADGYWVLQETGSAPSASAGESAISKAFATLTSFNVGDSDFVGGRTLYRMQPVGNAPLTGEMFGMAGQGISGFDATLVFLSDVHGALAGFDVAATWTQETEGTQIAAGMDLRWLVVETGSSVTVTAPKDVWIARTSPNLHYSLLYPNGWDVTYLPKTSEHAAVDDYVGPTDGEIQVYRYDKVAAGETANLWFREASAMLEKSTGVKPEVLTDLTLDGGLKVRVFALHATDDNGPFFFQEASIFAGNEAWDLDWYSNVGTETADQALFLSIVRTFNVPS